MTSPDPLIVIVGPTGVGKSRASISLAKRLGRCEIISADSMQVYRDFDIGSAKVTISEMDSIPHHLISIVDVDYSEFDVVEFVKRAQQAIRDIHARGNRVIVVGGTFYYVTALLLNSFALQDRGGLSSFVESSDESLSGRVSIHNQLGFDGSLELSSSANSTADNMEHDISNNIALDVNADSNDASNCNCHADHVAVNAGNKPLVDENPESLYARLSIVAPELAERLHVHDHRRVRRALQLFDRGHVSVPGNAGLQYPAILIWLDAQRDVIDTRIDIRVKEMVSQGILAQNRAIFRRLKPSPRQFEIGVAQAIGFKEFRRLYHDDNSSDEDACAKLLDEALSCLRAATCRYAHGQSRAIAKWFTSIPELPLFRIDTSGSLDGEKVESEEFSSLSSNLPPICSNRHQKPWRKFTCTICADRVVNGPNEWDAHLASRSHRRCMAKVKKAKYRRENDPPE